MTDTAGSSRPPGSPARRAAARRAVVPGAPVVPGAAGDRPVPRGGVPTDPAEGPTTVDLPRRGPTWPGRTGPDPAWDEAWDEASDGGAGWAASSGRLDLLPAWLLVPLAATVWWVLGFLPWLLSGFHDVERASDPARETGVGEHPLALPLLTMHLADLVLGGVVGGLLAGLLGLLSARRGLAVVLTAVGSALGLVTALVVTHQQLAGAGDLLFAQEPQVVTSLAVVLGTATLLGWLLGVLGVLGTARGPALAVGVAVLAGATAPLLSATLHAVQWDVTVLAWVPNAQFWASAVLVAVALGVIGVEPLTRLLWWPVVFGSAYLVWPVLRGLNNLAPQLHPGTSPDAIPALVGQAVRSARHALLPSERLMLPWGIALGLGLMIALVTELVRDSRLD